MKSISRQRPALARARNRAPPRILLDAEQPRPESRPALAAASRSICPPPRKATVARRRNLARTTLRRTPPPQLTPTNTRQVVRPPCGRTGRIFGRLRGIWSASWRPLTRRPEAGVEAADRRREARVEAARIRAEPPGYCSDSPVSESLPGSPRSGRAGAGFPRRPIQPPHLLIRILISFGDQARLHILSDHPASSR